MVKIHLPIQSKKFKESGEKDINRVEDLKKLSESKKNFFKISSFREQRKCSNTQLDQTQDLEASSGCQVDLLQSNEARSGMVFVDV